VKLKAAFPNSDLALFANQFLNVRLHLETLRDALTIPAAAVQRGAPGLYAWLVAPDGTVSMRALRLGATEGDRVQVLEGLAAGDRVVIDGTDKLKEGGKVEVIEPSANPAAGGARAPRGEGKPPAAGSSPPAARGEHHKREAAGA